MKAATISINANAFSAIYDFASGTQFFFQIEYAHPHPTTNMQYSLNNCEFIQSVKNIIIIHAIKNNSKMSHCDTNNLELREYVFQNASKQTCVRKYLNIITALKN